MEIKRNDSHYIPKIKAQNKKEIMRVILYSKLYDDKKSRRDVTILNLQHPSISPGFFFRYSEQKNLNK